MRPLLLASLFLATTACVSANDVICEGGWVCPAGSTCATVGAARICAASDQLAACAALADGSACEIRGVASACHGGLCLPSACDSSNTDGTGSLSSDLPTGRNGIARRYSFVSR
jgi:hypothetical protein